MRFKEHCTLGIAAITCLPLLGCASKAPNVPSNPSTVQPQVRISHLQHLYAGGGGCAERFWIEAIDFGVEVTNVEVVFSVVAQSARPQKGKFSIDRLGVSPTDSEAERGSETAGCPDGNAKIVINSATASVGGRTIDLLEKHMLTSGVLERFEITY